MMTVGQGTTMTIGELAGRFGLATHVLRHWESEGLLEPATRVNGRRRYGADQVARVVLILRGKAVGLSLADIREMLNAPDRASRQDVLRRHHAELEHRIAEAEVAKEMVEHALTCEYADFTRCPTFQHIAEGSCRLMERLDQRASPVVSPAHG
ncbi:MAG: MerR family transcriptional regulator [Thermomicrobiales bacterium]